MTLERAITIYQGETWQKLSLYLEEDLTGWSLRGDIRTNTLDRGGELLAEMTFFPLIYGPVTLPGATAPVNRSAILPSVSNTATAAIKVPPGDKLWRYDIFADSPGGYTTKVIAYGPVSILPRYSDV